MSNGAADVQSGDAGINWLGRDANGEVVDITDSIKTTTQSLTSDQIRTLDTFAVNLLPSQSGILLWPIGAVANMSGGDVGYDDGGEMQIVANAGLKILSVNPGAGWWSSPVLATAFFAPSPGLADSGVVPNTLDLICLSSPGNGNGTMSVTLVYLEIAVA